MRAIPKGGPKLLLNPKGKFMMKCLQVDHYLCYSKLDRQIYARYLRERGLRPHVISVEIPDMIIEIVQMRLTWSLRMLNRIQLLMTNVGSNVQIAITLIQGFALVHGVISPDILPKTVWHISWTVACRLDFQKRKRYGSHP